MRDSTMMYRTQCDAIRALPPEQFKAAVTAIWDYDLDGIIPSGDPVAVAMWMMAKPLIDKRNKNYENGKKGGRPKTEKEADINRLVTEPKPNDNRTETDSEPTCNLKDKGKRIKDKDINIYIVPDKSDSKYPYKDVIDYLNAKAGTKFKDTSKDSRRHIKARFDDGFTLEDFYKVIDGRVAAWKSDPRMCEYLRPQTLFGSKFESYLNAKSAPKANMISHAVDYDALERELLMKQAGAN